MRFRSFQRLNLSRTGTLSRAIEGLFGLTRCPSMALNLASHVPSGTTDQQVGRAIFFGITSSNDF